MHSWFRSGWPRRGALALLIGVLLTGAVAALVSAHGGSTQLVHSCVTGATGAVRIVLPGGSCGAGEASLDWPNGTPVAALQTQVSALQTQVTALQTQVAAPQTTPTPTRTATATPGGPAATSTPSPTSTPPASSISVDTLGDVGLYSSLALGSAGNPVVAYYHTGNANLKIARCGNPNCTGGNIIRVLDTVGDVGLYPSLALDPSPGGGPVIAYYDLTNGDLKVLHCYNDCASGNVIVAPDTTGDVGRYPSLALDSAGNPVVSYYDLTNTQLKVLHCGNPDCTAGNTIATPDFAGGEYTSLALDSQGRPVVSYFVSGTGLKVLHCGDTTCTVGNTIAVITAGNTHNTSLVLDAAGVPVIAYGESGGPGPIFVRCSDASCGTGNTILTLDTSTLAEPSVRLDAAGNPIISYHVQAAGGNDLKIVHCGNLYCTSGNVIATPDGVGTVGRHSSLALDAAGNPVVSHYDATNADLKVLHCGNPNCT